MSNCCLKSTAITVGGSSLKIEVPEMTFQSCCRYTIKVCQDIPCEALGLPVLIVSGSTEIPLWTCGNAVAVLGAYVRGQLADPVACRCNRTYTIPVQYVNTDFAMNPEHFTVTRRLKVCCDA